MLSLQLSPQRALPVQRQHLPWMPGGVVYFSLGTESSSHGAALPGETILEKTAALCSPGLQEELNAGTHRGCRGAGPAPDPTSPAPPRHQRTALCWASGGPRCKEVGAQLPPRVAGVLSRRSRPGSGCNHGKEIGQQETQGLPFPGGSEGTHGAAALAGQGGRYCPRRRVQTRHCWR